MPRCLRMACHGQVGAMTTARYPCILPPCIMLPCSPLRLHPAACSPQPAAPHLSPLHSASLHPSTMHPVALQPVACSPRRPAMATWSTLDVPAACRWPARARGASVAPAACGWPTSRSPLLCGVESVQMQGECTMPCGTACLTYSQN